MKVEKISLFSVIFLQFNLKIILRERRENLQRNQRICFIDMLKFKFLSLFTSDQMVKYLFVGKLLNHDLHSSFDLDA